MSGEFQNFSISPFASNLFFYLSGPASVFRIRIRIQKGSECGSKFDGHKIHSILACFLLKFIVQYTVPVYFRLVAPV